jgi:hypothetical protein
MTIKTYAEEDTSLITLLELDGEIFPMDNGYWTKIEAYKVEANEHIPHGVRYSLTLHDRHNNRIIGFDNAHAYRPKRKKYGSRKITWDHKHRREKISPYEYESAGHLLEDFWKEVEQII